MGSDQQQFALKWNKYRRNWSCFLAKLLSTRLLSDVVVACDGRLFNLHRLVLASCSLYFERTLQDVPIKETPVVVLNGVSGAEMELLVRFMYCGEATVSQPQLEPLLKAAERLQIKGLVKSDGESSDDAEDDDADDDDDTAASRTPISVPLSVPLSVPNCRRGSAGVGDRGTGRRKARKRVTTAAAYPADDSGNKQPVLAVMNGSSSDDNDNDDDDFGDGVLRIPGATDRLLLASRMSSHKSPASSATSATTSTSASSQLMSGRLAAAGMSRRKLSDSVGVHEALVKISSGEITVSEASLKYDIPIPTLYVNMRRIGIKARGRVSTSGVRKPRGVISPEMSRALDEIRRGCITASKASRKYNITLPRIMSCMRKMGIRSAFAKSYAAIPAANPLVTASVSGASSVTPSVTPAGAASSSVLPTDTVNTTAPLSMDKHKAIITSSTSSLAASTATTTDTTTICSQLPPPSPLCSTLAPAAAAAPAAVAAAAAAAASDNYTPDTAAARRGACSEMDSFELAEPDCYSAATSGGVSGGAGGGDDDDDDDDDEEELVDYSVEDSAAAAAASLNRSAGDLSATSCTDTLSSHQAQQQQQQQLQQLQQQHLLQLHQRSAAIAARMAAPDMSPMAWSGAPAPSSLQLAHQLSSYNQQHQQQQHQHLHHQQQQQHHHQQQQQLYQHLQQQQQQLQQQQQQHDLHHPSLYQQHPILQPTAAEELLQQLQQQQQQQLQQQQQTMSLSDNPSCSGVPYMF